MSEEIYEPMMDYDAVGRRIREYRTQAGMPQKELAELAHISVKHLSKLENGHHKGHFHVYYQIALALKIPVDVLAGGLESREFENLLHGKLAGLSALKKWMIVDYIDFITKYDI